MDFAANRQIKADRVYKTIGKMSWWRIIAGLALLALVFLMAGTVSEFFAERGHYKAAQFFMISPGWMEKHKPQEKAYFAAGVLFEEGDYAAAREACAAIGEYPPAERLEAMCCVRLAQERLAEQDIAGAYALLLGIDTSLLPEKAAEEVQLLMASLQQAAP